ncbi:MAG TPA: tRNA pseudouridine(55) synthase TruB [Actinomycetota bacterium]|nr:tRNA pseudouridine(55) synthase TruB [Actinomycetota bacterium]
MTDGLLLVRKPKGITSHDAVDLVRMALGTKKVGHAGTLDPMAEGLLLMGVGRATRLLRFLSELDKEYEGTIRLGVETDTLDAEGTVLGTAEVAVDEHGIREVMASLTGEIEQRPPAYSAVKVGGRPLHRAARRGEGVEAPVRRVRVDAFDLLRTALPDLDVRVVCSSGTYVRVLAADLGSALGCGAHLTRLERVRIGPFPVSDADPPESPSLRALEEAVGHLPRVTVEEEEAAAARHGRPLAPSGRGLHSVFDPEGRLVGVYRDDGAKARPEVVIPSPD